MLSIKRFNARLPLSRQLALPQIRCGFTRGFVLTSFYWDCTVVYCSQNSQNNMYPQNEVSVRITTYQGKRLIYHIFNN